MVNLFNAPSPMKTSEKDKMKWVHDQSMSCFPQFTLLHIFHVPIFMILEICSLIFLFHFPECKTCAIKR